MLDKFRSAIDPDRTVVLKFPYNSRSKRHCWVARDKEWGVFVSMSPFKFTSEQEAEDNAHQYLNVGKDG